MSRLALQPISIPKGVTVTSKDGDVTILGPKGSLKRTFRNEISLTVENNSIIFKREKDSQLSRALLGTYASHISNMISGVTEGFEKKLVVEGVGFKAEVEGKNLKMLLGFSHPILVIIPEGLTVTSEKNVITVRGIDKEQVGLFSSRVRVLKKPEPYKGKGIHYEGEIILRKQGKKAVT